MAIRVAFGLLNNVSRSNNQIFAKAMVMQSSMTLTQEIISAGTSEVITAAV